MPPPVVSDQELMPMVHLYTSYDDYYKAVFPLLLLETWEELSRAFKELKSRNEQRTFDNPIWIKSFQLVDGFEIVALTCQSNKARFKNVLRSKY